MTGQLRHLLEISGKKDAERSREDPGSDHEGSVQLEEDLGLALQLGDDPQSLKYLQNNFRTAIETISLSSELTQCISNCRFFIVRLSRVLKLSLSLHMRLA